MTQFVKLPQELRPLWALLAVDPRELSPREIENLKEHSAELLGHICHVLGNFPENVERVRRRRLHKADLVELPRERLIEFLAEHARKRALDFSEDWSDEISDEFFGPLDWFSETTIIVELLRERKDKLESVIAD
jgi:uncharacterized membrane protein YagU involved in acid resistance